MWMPLDVRYAGFSGALLDKSFGISGAVMVVVVVVTLLTSVLTSPRNEE